MNEYEIRKKIIKSVNITASEKLVLLSICFKIDWNTWSGKVSASQISEICSTGERAIKRTLSKLVEKKIISRSSKRIGADANESALTRLHHENLILPSEKMTTTPSVNITTPPSVNMTTTPSVNMTTHTISNNINNNIYQSSLPNTYNSDTREEEEEREVKKVYSFLYPSSITDPEERKRVEDHIKKNYHRLLPGDRQRLLYPDLAKPLI